MTSTTDTVRIFIDGASLGNPGQAGIGAVFEKDGVTLKNLSESIGVATNNIAEYKALVMALDAALKMNFENVRVFSDSELLCRQMSGFYKVKNESLRQMFSQALVLRRRFRSCEITQIPREKNKGADKLAKRAARMNQPAQTANKEMDCAVNDQNQDRRDGGPVVMLPGEESPSSSGQRNG